MSLTVKRANEPGEGPPRKELLSSQLGGEEDTRAWRGFLLPEGPGALGRLKSGPLEGLEKHLSLCERAERCIAADAQRAIRVRQLNQDLGLGRWITF
jgi:hypothetical protein